MKTFDRVTKVLENVLGVDKEEVTPQANLLTDLHMDSLDSLDMLFRLEREFGVQLSEKEVFPEFLLKQSELTDTDRVRVREHFPFLAEEQVAQVQEPKALMTVELLTGIIDWRMNTKAG